MSLNSRAGLEVNIPLISSKSRAKFVQLRLRQPILRFINET